MGLDGRSSFCEPANFMTRLVYYCLLGFLLGQSWACRSAGESEKVADVDGMIITRAELDRSGGKPLSNLRQQLYNMERQKLEEFIGATLLTREADKKRVSVTTLLEQEVNGKVGQVSEAEIDAFYNQYKSRISVGPEKVHDEIRDYLREQKLEAEKNN